LCPLGAFFGIFAVPPQGLIRYIAPLLFFFYFFSGAPSFPLFPSRHWIGKKRLLSRRHRVGTPWYKKSRIRGASLRVLGDSMSELRCRRPFPSPFPCCPRPISLSYAPSFFFSSIHPFVESSCFFGVFFYFLFFLFFFGLTLWRVILSLALLLRFRSCPFSLTFSSFHPHQDETLKRCGPPL